MRVVQMEQKIPFGVLILLMLSCSVANACSPVANRIPQTLQQKAEAAGEVFIGRVDQVSPEKVVFAVQQPGSDKLNHVTITPVNNTCGIAFTVGEVWLYMGATGESGSIRLKEEDFGVDPQDVIKRITQ